MVTLTMLSLYGGNALEFTDLKVIFRKFTRSVLQTTAVILNDSTAGRRDSFGLLRSVLMNVIGFYVSCKFGGNVKVLMYDEV